MQIEIEELNDYAAKRRQTISKIDSALDEIGIGNDVQRRLNDSFKVIAEFCARLQERACGQAVYDALVNVPVGILHASDPIGQHALKSALVGAIGEFVHWDINGALEIAADIAEDVNAHPEAARIREMARLAKEAAARSDAHLIAAAPDLLAENAQLRQQRDDAFALLNAISAFSFSDTQSKLGHQWALKTFVNFKRQARQITGIMRNLTKSGNPIPFFDGDIARAEGRAE